MTKPHEIAIALNTDHQVADEMEAINNRLRARIEGLAYTIHVHEKSLDEVAATVREREARIDMLTAVNAALSRENAQLGAEIVTLRAMGKGTR